MNTSKRITTVLLLFVLPALSARTAEIVLPQNRTAYYADEPIEVSVSGLAEGAEATVELKAKSEGPQPISFGVTGDGAAVTSEIPAFSLAPAQYDLLLDGKPSGSLKISRGLHSSTMYASQTGGKRDTGANFILSNAFSFGLHDAGQPTMNPRRRSGVLETYNRYVAEDMPSIVYMYWTGYVLHKPWGIHKEWVSPDMIENMRLFNFHVGQRMRRYHRNILMIGAIDEPGLPWGKTPSGGSASGFPGWNTAKWYEDRGWKYTNDPASGTDAEWLKYMAIRASMLREPTAQARDDIKQSWPEATFSSDLYAPQAPGDGTDPWNQVANDTPSTHVFADYGIGKLGVLAGMYVEKAHDPLAKIAHAMNGQLFGARIPNPQSRYAYHLMTNVMLAAGLRSNWWLNYNPMGKEQLVAVNGPAHRIGPVFAEMNSTKHDLALLWSTTEIWMRCKEISAKEAHKKSGEQIGLMVADLPENAYNEKGEVTANAYTVGGNYKGEVLTAMMAMNRAGYPSHIIHERLLTRGALENYKTLVIVGQTFDLGAPERKAITDFIARGGKLIVDRSTKARFPGAIVVDAPPVVNQGYKWVANFSLIEKSKDTDQAREHSYYRTNHFMESFSRDAADAMKAVLGKTKSQQVISTQTKELACERHAGGEGDLVMVINGYEELPEIEDTVSHNLWNYAPFQATYSLPCIRKGSEVWRIEGLDWRTVARVEDPTAPQTASFQPGEMKLYLVSPHAAKGIKIEAALAGGVMKVSASLERKALLGSKPLRVPWPVVVTVADPSGNEIVKLYRAFDAQGQYRESVPLGLNAAAGRYTVTISSKVADLRAAAEVQLQPGQAEPQSIAEKVRVFDGTAIAEFLASKPAITVAVPAGYYQPVADEVAATLKARGLEVEVRPESEVWRKAKYPRVWDPYVKVYRPTKEDKLLPDDKVQDKGGNVSEVKAVVKQELIIESLYYDAPEVKTKDGKPFKGNWRAPGNLITVAGTGFIDRSGPEKFYEVGCKLWVGVNPRLFVVAVNGEAEEVKTTPEVRERWSRPWKNLVGHVGGHNLTPQLPEAYASDDHLILMGNSKTGELVRALQASELLPQVVDDIYPGSGKALLSFAWSPFGLEKNVILIGATDLPGVEAGAKKLLEIAPGK